MPATDLDQPLLERLNRHPLRRARVESLLEVVEAAAGDGEKADAAERRVVEERRQRGNAALTAWAERGVEKSMAVAQAVPEPTAAAGRADYPGRPISPPAGRWQPPERGAWCAPYLAGFIQAPQVMFYIGNFIIS